MNGQPEKFTASDACDKTRALWLGVADFAESSVEQSVSPLELLQWASVAEAVSWQATGEGDCFSVKGILAGAL